MGNFLPQDKKSIENRQEHLRPIGEAVVGTIALTAISLGVGNAINSGEESRYDKLADSGTLLLMNDANIRDKPNVPPAGSEPNVLATVNIDGNGLLVDAKKGILSDYNQDTGIWYCAHEADVAQALNKYDSTSKLNPNEKDNIVCVSAQKASIGELDTSPNPVTPVPDEQK